MSAAVTLGTPRLHLRRTDSTNERARTLAAAGFSVSNLAGGMQSWQEDGLPVVNSEGHPGRIG